jgi:hypothetical protein
VANGCLTGRPWDDGDEGDHNEEVERSGSEKQTGNVGMEAANNDQQRWSSRERNRQAGTNKSRDLAEGLSTRDEWSRTHQADSPILISCDLSVDSGYYDGAP